MASYSTPKKERTARRGSVRSQGKAPVTVCSGTSAAGSAFQGLEVDLGPPDTFSTQVTPQRLAALSKASKLTWGRLTPSRLKVKPPLLRFLQSAVTPQRLAALSKASKLTWGRLTPSRLKVKAPLLQFLQSAVTPQRLAAPSRASKLTWGRLTPSRLKVKPPLLRFLQSAVTPQRLAALSKASKLTWGRLTPSRLKVKPPLLRFLQSAVTPQHGAAFPRPQKVDLGPCLSRLSGTSAAGSAFQGLKVDLGSPDTFSMAIENLGTFSVPDNQPFDPEGSFGPDIQLGRVRPMTRSQRELGQALRGEKDSNEPPAQTKSCRKRKQPSQNLTTKSLGALQLPEALELPHRLQLPSSLSSQPSSSHHSEYAVGNLDSPGPTTLRSTTRSGPVSTPAPMALSQAFLTVSGPPSSAPGSSSDENVQELSQQTILQAPDDGVFCREPDSRGSVIPGGWVLRSRVVTFGHHSPALVSPEVQPEVHTIGWNLRPRATPRIPVLHSGPPVSSPDTGSRATQSRSRSRSASRPSRSTSGPALTTGDKALELELESESEAEAEAEPESEPEAEAEAEPESEPESESEPELVEMEPGPRSQSQARPFTSTPTLPRRSSHATASSPPRRPVRMRASSPSPPGRLYPLPGQYGEGASSSSSSTSELCVSSPHSLKGSSPPLSDLSSVSGPSPNTLWRALIPDLDNLHSSSEEETEDDPHSPAEGEV
ncbi:EZH inhibitory protein [Rattus rattus]|uniref:EZH inhibitory protein n=1 Tax=Rattus rattus TaxID=10117 RepID=UPI0013F352DC|nr:EZH inhibitory protein [Rattus rattus]